VTTIPDREIYLAARAGDRAALARLVSSFAPALYNAALWIGAGDVRYAARVRRRTVRSFQRMIEHTEDEEQALVELFRGFANAVDPRPGRSTSDDPVRRRIATLPRRHALALTLTAVAGLRHARVASVLGLDVRQVRVLIHEAREAVRAAEGGLRAERETLGEVHG
jgi:DNA-directed RNA polymerase specialized sigma24 family protein